MKPRDIGNGRFIVTRTENFVHWCAWRYWLHRETGRTVFLEKLCVWSEWPPESLELAQAIVQQIKASRDKIGYGLHVCDPAQPWDRWSVAERLDIERRHREDFWWNPELPEPRGPAKPGKQKTAVEKELDDWTRNVAATKPKPIKGQPLPRIRSSWRPKERWEIPPDEREPIPYVPHTPEQRAELLAALERKNALDFIPPLTDPRD